MYKIAIKNIIRPVARRVKRILRPPLHKEVGGFKFKVLGTEYGGWPVLDGSLSPNSIVYCFGVGDDISFDLELIAKYGCVVEAFDPTPRCIAWLAGQNVPDEFRFHSIGLAGEKKVLSFSAPPQKDFVSYTVGDRTDITEIVELPVEPLDSLMKQLGHSHLDFLKMDIEGCEYEVIHDMISKGIFPKQLCVEFHHGMYGFRDIDTNEAVEQLLKAGYVLHYVSRVGREYAFHFDKKDS